MKGKKIIIISIIINILTIGVIYNFIKKDYLNNEKIIVKTMTEGEYEDNITALNQSHTDYANYIQESKIKIASALTDMGVPTSNEETLETMASNIRSLTGALSADKVSYDNTNSGLTATNVQGAVDELNESLEEQPQFVYDENGKITGYTTKIGGADTVFPFTNNEHAKVGVFTIEEGKGTVVVDDIGFKPSTVVGCPINGRGAFSFYPIASFFMQADYITSANESINEVTTELTDNGFTFTIKSSRAKYYAGDWYYMAVE